MLVCTCMRCMCSCLSIDQGRSSSADLSLDCERHLFTVDLTWRLLGNSTTLHESLLQVAVWVSVVACFLSSCNSLSCLEITFTLTL